jgi:hypothetical protein
MNVLHKTSIFITALKLTKKLQVPGLTLDFLLVIKSKKPNKT